MAWTCHVPPVDPRCTWPAITQARAGIDPAPGEAPGAPLAGAGAAGDGAGDAGYIAGPLQVHGRYMAGRREGYRRSTGGTRGLAGWGSVPVASLTWSPAWITTPPRPAPRRLPARADTRTARWMPSTPPMPPSGCWPP